MSDEQTETVYVFFATADWRRSHVRLTTCQWLRIARRRPRKAYFACLAWLTRTITRSRLAHVSIGHNGVVLDPDIKGNRAWPLVVYVSNYPTLVCAFSIKTPDSPPLDSLPLNNRKPVLPTLLRWWTGGRVHTEDCVCITVDMLRAAGVDVPKRIYQPIQLHRWLHDQGYPHVLIDADARHDSRTH